MNQDSYQRAFSTSVLDWFILKKWSEYAMSSVTSVMIFDAVGGPYRCFSPIHPAERDAHGENLRERDAGFYSEYRDATAQCRAGGRCNMQERKQCKSSFGVHLVCRTGSGGGGVQVSSHRVERDGVSR